MKQLHYHYQKKEAGISIEQAVYRTGSYHYNWHTELELLVVLKGEIEVCSHALCRVLQEDDVALINPNSGHATFSREADSVAMVLHADPRFLSSYYEDSERLHFALCTDAASRYSPAACEIRRQLAAMAQNAEIATPGQKLALDSAFYCLMDGIIRNFPPEHVQEASFQADGKKLEAMDTILKYIHKNYRKRISLDSIAKMSGYNASYLSQLFKSSLGINFYDYLTRIRLREATRQLSQTDERILDIALENGFSDLKSFNSVFRKTFRKSPTEYRSQLSEDHARNDLSFKKEYLAADDALLCRKLEQYRQAGQAAANAPAEQPDDRALYRQVEALLSGVHTLEAQAEQLSAALEAAGLPSKIVENDGI